MENTTEAEGAQDYTEFRSVQAGDKLTPIPTCKLVRSKITGQIFPFTPMMKDAGNMFEPYYGDFNATKLETVEEAIQTLYGMCKTPYHSKKVEGLVKKFRAGDIPVNGIVGLSRVLSMRGTIEKEALDKTRALFTSLENEVYEMFMSVPLAAPTGKGGTPVPPKLGK